MPKVEIIAREWIGTPFLHGQSVKSVGADCAGVVMGILRECKMLTLEQTSEFHCGAPRIMPPNYLRERLGKVCRKVRVPKEGDVLLFEIGGVEQHLALCVGNNRMVHALVTLGKAAEQEMDARWTARLVGVFRVRRAK